MSLYSRARMRPVLLITVSMLLVSSLAVAAFAITGERDGTYRTASAATGTVTETYTGSGTIDATQRSDIATAVDGTVQRVDVSTGDAVKAGDLLLALDRADAERAVRSAQATLAQAEADLDNAEHSQEEAIQAVNDAVSTGSDSQPSATDTNPASVPAAVVEPRPAPASEPTPQPAPAADPAPDPGPPDEEDEVSLPTIELPSLVELRQLQDAVKTAQTSANTALADADSLLAAQIDTCAQAYGRAAASSDGNENGQGGPADDPPGGQLSDEANDACDRALTAVQAAQQLVSEKQAELQASLDDLTAMLVAATERTDTAIAALQAWIDEQASASTETPPSSETPGASAGRPSPADDEGTQTGSPTDSTSPDLPSSGEQVAETPSAEGAEEAGSPGAGPAAADASGAPDTRPDTTSAPASRDSGLAAVSAFSIARAQASVDTATAELLRARHELNASQVVALSDGTVTAVQVTEGDTVAAGDVVIVVVGDGGATVTLSLNATSVRKVDVGQIAGVTFPGSTASIEGEVTWVSPVAASGGGASFGAFAPTSTYTAFIHLPADALGERVLPQGARVDVSVMVGASEDVTTVPTSAIVTTDAGTSIRVLGDAGPETRTVEVGRIGPRLTEVVSGLEVGEDVVLADLNADIDAVGEVNNTTSLPGPGGRGFPGGGQP